ncbi:MAG: hypothetical protein CBC24_05075 [Candidatus Pelagibacter sp. TMED64]|nr:MAG: hypothetical protein CBC24_05075 [Candidatus Pelagibacter sp. TMED64]|tara:strand:+ start:207 stop:695 length:489 start_codon:yes stop_codon:yes gene_type:complete
MAIKDTSRKPYIEDNDTRVKIGIDLPIRRGDSFEGYFASSSTTIEAVKNNIRNLLNTHRGERVFQPNLGLNLRRLLFEHITSDNLLGVQNAILDQLELWLPFVEVRDIKIFRKEDDIVVGSNEIRVKIIFNIKQDPNTLDSVTMDFSGQINESESLTTGGSY